MNMELINLVVLFIIGTIFGSFYNVVGYRLPNEMSIVFPNSHCTNCKKRLKWYELIPIISYIFLIGKCKKCKQRISIMYPLFEFITGILFVISYLVFGIGIEFIISIIFVSILVIISISDIKYYIIPDEVLITGVILIAITNIINTFLNDLGLLNGVIMPLLNGLGSFSILFLFKFIGDIVLKKESMGGGDIKLLFVIGLVLGFEMSIVTIFIASFIALPLSVFSLIKNNNNVLPFGPYLALASIIILFTNLDLQMIINFIAK